MIDGVVVAVPRIDPEAHAQHAARAARRDPPGALDRHRGAAVLGEEAVERTGEVGRGVGERAVEVEQDGADRHRAAGRTAWSM